MSERSDYIENHFSNFVRIKNGKNFLFAFVWANRKRAKHFATMHSQYIKFNNILVVKII